MRVRDVVTEAAVTESATDTLASAAEVTWRQQTRSLLVMDGGRLAGIITERDVLRAVALGADLATSTVFEAMTTDVLTVPPDTSLRDAAKEMATQWISQWFGFYPLRGAKTEPLSQAIRAEGPAGTR
jgi:CBS domain-containing protein